jgi:predicted RNase H-like HicB family nuclease
MRYTVVLIRGAKPGRYVAHVPAIPGCVTQGDSPAEAIAMARDAAAAMVADVVEHGEEVAIEAAGGVIASVEVPVPAGFSAVAQGAPSPVVVPALPGLFLPWDAPQPPRQASFDNPGSGR